MRTVSAVDAKIHLSHLLKEVEAGASITIKRHGTPVAILSPITERRGAATREIIDGFHAFRRGKRLGNVNVRDLIGDGRR